MKEGIFPFLNIQNNFRLKLLVPMVFNMADIWILMYDDNNCKQQ